MTDPRAREDTLRQAASRGREAAALAEHPLLLEAFAELAKDAMSRLENSAPGTAGVQTREDAFAEMRMLGMVKGKLLSWLTTGRNAKERLEQMSADHKAEPERRGRRA